MPTHEWSKKYKNVKIDYQQFAKETVAVIVAISSERGIDQVSLFKYSVNREKFALFLQELRDKYFFDDICLYMDNLSVHRSNFIKDRMDEIGFAYIWAPTYSPEYNPTEFIIGLSK